jgi:amidohydrolase
LASRIQQRGWISKVFVVGLALAIAGGAFRAEANVGDLELRRLVKGQLPRMLAFYKKLHANPELSGQEKWTSKQIAIELRKLGMQVKRGVGGNGVVGILRNGQGPTLLYRADMDALPIVEATGLPYASRNKGVMHACGHDIHMSVGVGAMKILAALRKHWGGTLLYVSQPAEETGKGARAMLADPVFKKILAKVGKPKLALALHDSADLPAGQVSLVSGYAAANVDSMDIIVHGKGGHGARPQEAIDPILIASEIVVALQSIVARRISPTEKAVVTVGKFSAGSKHNIIPAKATLLLTIRSYTDKVRKLLLDEIRRVALNVAKAHHAPRDPEVILLDEFTPALFNNPQWTERLRHRFSQILGGKNVQTHIPSMGGEDFGQFSRRLKIPGVMWKLGAAFAKGFDASKPRPGLHSAKYAPDAGPTLFTGMLTASSALLFAFGPPSDAPAGAR